MNKKPVLLRTIVALVVLVIFAFQMHPLKERDFYDTFRTIWIDSNAYGVSVGTHTFGADGKMVG